jgi:hypothetical protein
MKPIAMYPTALMKYIETPFYEKLQPCDVD